MIDNMTATPEQKKELTVQALGIAGFTEKEQFQGMYTQEHDMKTIVVNTNESPIKPYFNIDGKKITDDDEYETLKNIRTIIKEAETGQMPSRGKDPDIIVTTTMQGAQPDDMQIKPEHVPDETTTPIDSDCSALVPLSTTTDIVRPAVSALQAIAAWNEFQDLKKAILQPTDLQKIQGKDFMKKSAWRKFATFFNLNDKIVEETQTPHQDGQGWTWKIKVICTAPNGRFTEGVGMCSTSERNFAHVEHDTYATAHTRAKNRAISDMVAAGEVSAEEVSA